MHVIQRTQIAKELDAFCDKFPTFSAAAAKLDITLAQLSTARNDPDSVIPGKALKKLGYAYMPVYVRSGDVPKSIKAKASKRPSARATAAAATKRKVNGKKVSVKRGVPSKHSNPTGRPKPVAAAAVVEEPQQPVPPASRKPAPPAVVQKKQKIVTPVAPPAAPRDTNPPPQSEKIVSVTAISEDGVF